MEKTQARKKALSARNSLDKTYAANASDVIIDRFLEEFAGYGSFLCYHNVRSEVSTERLIKILYGMKKAVYLPRVVGDDIETVLYDGDESLVLGEFGVLEPAGCACFDHIDVVVVPATAFDERCVRVGYGKGYYDRLLKKGRTGLKVGFAYECQKTDNIAFEPHDIPCDLFITEKYIYRRNS